MVKTEIRIVNPSQIVWDVVNKLAKKEKRFLGRQAEYMIEKYIEEHKL